MRYPLRHERSTSRYSDYSAYTLGDAQKFAMSQTASAWVPAGTSGKKNPIAPTRDRTEDLAVNSRSLYQRSSGGECRAVRAYPSGTVPGG